MNLFINIYLAIFKNNINMTLQLHVLLGEFLPAIGRIIINSLIGPTFYFFLLRPNGIGSMEDLLQRSANDVQIAKNTYFNTLGMVESGKYHERKHASWRALMAQDLLFQPFCAVQGSTNTDLTNSYPPNPASQRATSRFRGYDEFCISHVLFIVGGLIMNDPAARSVYLTMVTDSTLVPTVWNELNTSHRSGYLGEYIFNIGINPLWQAFITKLGLKQTIWDIEWLRKPSNMGLLISKLNGFLHSPACYIATSPAVRNVENTGSLVSAACIDTSTDSSVPSVQLRLWPNANIPINALPVYQFDATVLGRSFYDDTAGKTRSNNTSPRFEVILNTNQAYAEYFVYRMDGTYSNSPPPLSTEPQTSTIETSTNTTTASQRPQRQRNNNSSSHFLNNSLLAEVKNMVQSLMRNMRNKKRNRFVQQARRLDNAQRAYRAAPQFAA